ncbi:MAG: hypothetical protein QM490_00350, partial [Candidatus Gracilibacteria bacterium]
DLTKFMNLVDSMFKYIKENKEDLLLLQGSELKDLKISFRGVQDKVKKMIKDDTLINTLLLSDDNIMIKKSLIQLLVAFHEGFKKTYYLIIPNKNEILPAELVVSNIIKNVRNPDFIDDDNIFYSTINHLKTTCIYIVKEDLSGLNLEQLKEVRSNVKLLFTEINNLLVNRNKKIDRIKAFTIEGIIGSTGRANSVNTRLNKLIKEKIFDNFSYENTADLIDELPKDSAKELSNDEGKFQSFLNEFRILSNYILSNKSKFENFNTLELERIRLLLIKVFNKISEIGKRALEKEKEKIRFNVIRLMEGKLAQLIGV